VDQKEGGDKEVQSEEKVKEKDKEKDKDKDMSSDDDDEDDDEDISLGDISDDTNSVEEMKEKSIEVMDDNSVEKLDDAASVEMTKSNMTGIVSSKSKKGKRLPTDPRYHVDLVKTKKLPRIPSEYSNDLANMIHKMLSLDAKDRPDLIPLLESDLLQVEIGQLTRLTDFVLPFPSIAYEYFYQDRNDYFATNSIDK
jgi:hypothetical protein